MYWYVFASGPLAFLWLACEQKWLHNWWGEGLWFEREGGLPNYVFLSLPSSVAITRWLSYSSLKEALGMKQPTGNSHCSNLHHIQWQIYSFISLTCPILWTQVSYIFLKNPSWWWCLTEILNVKQDSDTEHENLPLKLLLISIYNCLPLIVVGFTRTGCTESKGNENIFKRISKICHSWSVTTALWFT